MSTQASPLPLTRRPQSTHAFSEGPFGVQVAMLLAYAKESNSIKSDSESDGGTVRSGEEVE
ncbi:hypothetical protein LRD18_11955 [Halorhodospira halochloris]|uniref:hypothetical protein n=1 Tax=Halorhodospira halochloris TaxID=1052 RepID=UPI001EE877B7|nr:hypothetical protein [Halorhodospira halochloris]MCG5531558.1 hypothetical protein [Halorhodospira halochloris]